MKKLNNMHRSILLPSLIARGWGWVCILLLLASCSDQDEHWGQQHEIHPELIGRAVNFNASHADPFVTRATYRHDGSFNEQDIMYIYRQYIGSNGTDFDPATRAYRVYWLTTRYAAGTSFALETDWKPKEGAWGYNPDTDEYEGKRGLFKQTEADSLTWENGKTVRFRAWSRSNVAGAISNCTTSSSSSATDKENARNRYYPDYCVSEWVTVSGPTLDVPLTLKHQGCRIALTTKAGNELFRAEICTDWEDYKRIDNADTKEHDESVEFESGKTDEQAKEEHARVMAVYNRMCMPAGIDVNNALLQTMTSAMFNNNAVNLGDLTGYSYAANTSRTEYTAADGLVAIGSKDSTDIRTDVQRPQFCSNDGRLYMITVPYDMSREAEGEALKLPLCTRIKVWLYDVNNGDKASTGGTEATYHIFTLGDVRKSDDSGDKLFPDDGMELTAGKSYLFSVGYHYDHFTVTAADNFSWEQQDAEAGNAIDQAQTQPTIDYTSDDSYRWWKKAIKDAIPTKENGKKDYIPEFHIKTQKEFLEFIKLVNGTAPGATSGLTILTDPTKTFTVENPATESDYRWYRDTQVSGGQLRPSVDPADSVTHETAIAEGYIFYQRYYPANATQYAYSIEDYLRGPYSFYNDNLKEHWKVYLDNDLDLYDWQLDAIGNEDGSVALNADGSHPFRGVFDGQMHTLKNINMQGGYMFKHCFGAAIRNLKIETTHNFMLLDTAQKPTETGYGCYVVGVSIKAPSSGNPIARSLTGSSYVVGCIYQGKAGGAMVGTADDLWMYGNMMAATGLPKNSGALLGSYAGSNRFFAPQTGKNVVWGRFMANYYLMDHYNASDATDIVHAVGTITDAYRPQEYIRGALPWVLKAKNDNMISGEVPYERLSTELMRKGYYGLAPWKAMNYALYIYNSARVTERHDCGGHFVNNSTGYAHTYPELKAGMVNTADDTSGLAGNYDSLNLLELFN